MSSAPLDLLLTNARIATLNQPGDYGLVEQGALGIKAGSIAYVGPAANAPDAQQINDVDGRLITPGLMDCHTHLVYGGNRAAEFEQRLNGASYEDVARAGGGIISTVRATRQADEAELLAAALVRVDHLLAEGVTSVEIKSGYGLDLQSEIKMLKVARQIEQSRPVRVVTSFLGAHAVPPEFAGDSDGYLTHLVNEMLPTIGRQGLADHVDGFCETIAFLPSQIAQLFDAAQALDLPIKLHAEQLSDQGGAAMAAKRGALSVDHLEYLSPADAAVLAENNTVAVLLPGAFYTLRETRLPPVDALRQSGVDIAIATDANPGSSPLTSLLIAMNMAATLFRLTPAECLAGVTRNAAKALGLHKSCGTLEVGKRADLAIWDVTEPAELSYRIGFNPLYQCYFEGQLR